MPWIKSSGLLVWRGDTGTAAWKNESVSKIEHMPNPTAQQTFASAMEAHSLCTVGYWLYGLWYSLTAGAPGVGANIENKGLVYFRDPDTLEVLNFQYPDPIAAEVETTQWGKKIKDSAVTAIVGLLNTMTSKSYIPLYGVYYVRK